MTKKIFPKTVLFSVSDKRGLVPFAKFLERNGTRIIASGGTASVLKKNNIKVKKVSSITRFPEVFGGPAGFGKVRAAGRINFLQLSSKSELMVPSYDQQKQNK